MTIKMLVFFAHWCPKCNMMMPIVEEVEKHYVGKIEVVRIDIGRNSQKAREHRVEMVPTFILYRNGREVGRMSGLIGEQMLYQRIDKVLG